MRPDLKFFVVAMTVSLASSVVAQSPTTRIRDDRWPSASVVPNAPRSFGNVTLAAYDLEPQPPVESVVAPQQQPADPCHDCDPCCTCFPCECHQQPQPCDPCPRVNNLNPA